MAERVELWQVYHLYCRHTKPLPKYKYVVIVCTEPTPMGFLVNSKINQFIIERPKLLVCEVKIEPAQHSFLSHTSYVDCRDLFPFELAELTDLRGTIDSSVQPDILAGVSACPVLPAHHKQMIRAAHHSPD